MTVLLKILFFAILSLTLVRFLVSYILPYLLAKFFNNLQQKAQEQQKSRYQRTRQPRQAEGNIKVNYIPPQYEQKTNSAKKAGEFVEFEEIKAGK